MREYIVLILLFLVSINNFAWANEEKISLIGYPNAMQTNYKLDAGATTPACGFFTGEPEVKTIDGKNYFLVKLYVVRLSEWPSTYFDRTFEDYSNSIGGFSFNIEQPGNKGAINWYSNKFKSVEFIISPEFTSDLPANYLSPTKVVNFGQFGKTNVYSFAYDINPDCTPNKGPFPKIIILEERKPFCIGQLKCEIVDNPDKTLTTGFILNTESCGFVFYGSDEDQGASTNYRVVGYLDKNPDIPLVPEVPSTTPEDPTVPTGLTPLCAGLESVYAIASLPKNADLTTWKVFKEATEVNSDVAELALGADKKSVTIKWKQAGTYQVKVWGKSSSSNEESANPGVLSVTVNAAPAIALKRDNALITTAAQKTICSGIPLNLSVAQVSGVTYTWQDGSKNSAFSVTPTNKGNADITQKYKITATQNNCSASDSVTMTVYQEPDCVFDPTTTSYPIGSQVSCALLCNNTGSPLQTYSWTSPVTSAESSIQFELPAGETAVVVTATNSKGCSQTFTEVIKDNGQGLKAELVSVYGNEICQGGAALLKATLTKTVGSGPYIFKWYSGQGATGTLLATHEVNSTEDMLTVDEFTGTTGIYYSVKVTNSSMLATTANSPELTINSGKTPGTIIAESPLVAATPDKRVLLSASTSDAGTFDWQWMPAELIDGEAKARYAMTTPVNETTKYTVLMHNTALGNGCLSKKEVEVRLPENNFAMSVSPTDWTLCQNGSIQLNTTVSGGGIDVPKYKWTSLVTTGAPGNISGIGIANPKYTAYADKSGIHEYLLRVERGTQVVTTKVTVEVKDYKAPVLALGNVFCSDSNLVVTPTGGAASGYEWLIKKPDNTWITKNTTAPVYAFAQEPGEYQVKVVAKVDGTCVSDTTYKSDIEVKRPTVTQTVLPTVYAKGANVVSTAVADNGWGDYTYNWVVAGKSGAVLPEQDKKSNLYTVSGADEDSYSFNLTVKDVKGCEAVAEMKTVNANANGMDVQLALVNKYCGGGSVLMGAMVTGGKAPYTYTWKKEDGTVLKTEQVSETTNNYFIAAADVEAAYLLTVTDATTPAVLTINKKLSLTPENLPVPEIATEGNIKITPATPAVLRAELTTPTTGVYQWQWSGNYLSAAEAQKQYAVTNDLASGTETYEVYVVDGNGCISAPQTENVVVDETNGFNVTVNATTLAMCKNTRQLLEALPIPAQEGATYDWASVPENLFTAVTKNQQKPEITPNAAGAYRIVVTVTNQAGIKNTAKVDITVKDQIPPQLTWNYNSCQGDTIRISDGGKVIANGYTWYVDGSEVIGNKGNYLPVAATDFPLNIKSNYTIRVVAEGTNDCVADEEKDYTLKEQPLLAWDPEPTGIEVGVPFTAQVKASPESGSFDYHWTKPAAGTPGGRTCTITASASDKSIDFQVYAVDQNTGCKTNVKEKKVNVESDVLVPNVFVLNDKVCTGGSAVLEVLSVSGADGPFNYEWKKDGSTEVVGRGQKLVVSPVNAAMSYTVTVSKQADARKKGSKSVALTPVSGYVPTLDPFNISVAPGNSAVLVATTNARNPEWNWGPAERLASAAECHKAYPETMTFTHTGDSIYEVYVVDQEGCISPKKNLVVHIQNDNVFRINLTPNRELCIGSRETYTAEITGGTGSVVSSVWLAQQTIEGVADNLLQAVYKAGKAGSDTVAVVVNKGGLFASAKQVVTIRSQQAPTLEFTPVNPCADSLLIVKAADGSALKDFNWKITKNGTALADVTTDRMKLSEGNYTLHITATGANDCPANAINEKDFTVYANPVIQNLIMDTDCDTTRLAAVTTNGDSWAWTKVSGITGTVATGMDSLLVLPHVNNAMSGDYKYSVIAGNVHGCHSAPAEKTGTVYTLPEIKMNPAQKNLYPNKDLTIEATMTPALNYTLAWGEQGNIASQLSDTKIQTNKLPIGDYAFTFTVTNTANTGCSKVGTTNVHVTDADMKVKLEGLGDTLELCDGTTYSFKAIVEDNMTDVNINYQVKDPTGKITTTPSADGSFDCVFTLKGDNRYHVYVTATDTELNKRHDTVVVNVNENPHFQFKDVDHVLGNEFALCAYNGKLEVEVQATKGTPSWELYYRVGTSNVQKHMAAADDKLLITEGGEVWIDSIVDAKKCKFDMTEDPYGFMVVNDIPQFKLTTDQMTICQNTVTDLGIQITAKTTDYPLEVFAKRGVVKDNKILNSAADVLGFDLGSATRPVTFTIDSIRSSRTCTFKPATKQTVKVDEYPETTPKLTLPDTTTREFCVGDIVEIPVNITGGKADYTISYKLGNTAGQKVWTAADNKIELSEAGIFRITGLADGNGCGSFVADDSVRLMKYVLPSLKINNATLQMCGGQLDLDMTLANGTAPYTIYYTKDGGAEQTKEISTLTADKKAVWAITEAGNYSITKVADAHCEIAGTDVNGGPDLSVTPLRLYAKMKSNETVCATAGANIELDFTGTFWGDVKGGVRVSYDFTPAGAVVAEQKFKDFTLAEAQAEPKITPAPQGTYLLTSVVDLGANSCGGLLSEVASENQITVIDAPTVTIDSSDFAALKDESFVLGVKNPEGSKFEYAWQINDGEFTVANAPFSKADVMGDVDLKYVLKGTNKTATSCFNTDTVTVFRIPDAPVLTIDTIDTRNQLVLQWTMPAGQIVDGYTLMSNQWDAYGIEKAYDVEAGLFKTASDYQISESNIQQDTLKFFYMLAQRKVKTASGMKTYVSASSDTVGYYNVNLLKYPKGSNNVVTMYFDPEYNNIKKAGDLLKQYTGIISFARSFKYSEQVWITAKKMGLGVLGDFDIEQGMVLQLEVLTESSFLQYGKLPNIYEFTLKGENLKGNNNMYFLQPWRIDLKMASDILQEVGTDLSFVRYWLVTEQVWVTAKKFGQGFLGNFKLLPLMPLQMEMKKDATKIWK